MPPAAERSAQPASEARQARAGSSRRPRSARASAALQARGTARLRAVAGGRLAARHMRTGLLALGWAEDGHQPDARRCPAEHHALAARLLMSLAHCEAEQGRTEYGLRLLDQAERLAARGDRGVLLSQRGLLFVRTWRGRRDALRLLDEAGCLLRDYPATRVPGPDAAQPRLVAPQHRPRPAGAAPTWSGASGSRRSTGST